MLHKPAAKLDDFVFENDNESTDVIANNPFCAAIDEFVRNDPNCPIAIREDYVKKMDTSPEEQCCLDDFLQNIEDLCPEEEIPEMEPLQDEWMAQMRPAGADLPRMRVTEEDLDMAQMNPDDLQEHNLCHDSDHDWSIDARELNLTTDRDLTFLQGWLSRTRDAVQGHQETASERTYRPDALNQNQAQVFQHLC